MKRKVRFSRWSEDILGYSLRFDSNTYLLDFVLGDVSLQYNASIIFENLDISNCKVREYI